MAIATHTVKVTYFVSSEKDEKRIRAEELANWKLRLGDALENIEVEKL